MKNVETRLKALKSCVYFEWVMYFDALLRNGWGNKEWDLVYWSFCYNKRSVKIINE